MFLQGWRSYLGMRKDEWTYLLEQKCPNKTRDHKSATVNLGETKPSSTRIYLFCTNRQLTLRKKKILFHPPPPKVYEQKQTLPSEISLFLVASKLRNIGHSWIIQQNCHYSQCQLVSLITDDKLFGLNCLIIFVLMDSTVNLFFPQPWQDVFIYTANFNKAIQTGICLLDINHLPWNTLADQKFECVSPHSPWHVTKHWRSLSCAQVSSCGLTARSLCWIPKLGSKQA